MAEMYWRGFKENDFIICDSEAFWDGKCEFILPSPIGRMLWEQLMQCGLIRCGKKQIITICYSYDEGKPNQKGLGSFLVRQLLLTETY